MPQKLKNNELRRRIAKVLTDNRGNVVSVRDILNACYGDDPEGGPDNAANVLRQTIYEMRKQGSPIYTISGYMVP